MNYAAEWDAEHAKREMFVEGPLRPVEKWFEPWKDKEPPSVLDIGCGQGTNSIWLGGMGFKVCGFDSSPAAIRRACWLSAGYRWRIRHMPRLIVADATKPWPYQNGAFDIAFEVRVLENLSVEEVRYAYSEVARVLKPDGLFFCLTASQDRSPRYTTCGQTRMTTDLELAEWFSAVGLKIVCISREYRRGLEDWNVQAIRQ
jgi:SAM-dependent methyltransferase